MAEITKQTRRRAKDSSDKARSKVEDQAPDTGGSDDDGAGDAKGGGLTITSELKDTFREAAVEVLRPVMRKATTSAAKYAVTKGPGLVKDKVMPRIEEAGGAGGIAGSLGGMASGLGDKLPGKKKEGKSPSGTGRGRRLPVQVFVDVAVDLQTAYDQFTQFEDWPKFMHRVESIEQRDDATLMWNENIWGVRRSWEAEITEQTPCERIAWRSKNGPQTIGVVTFHRLSENLTRIYVTMDFQPKGLFEKTASGMRISRRALKSDLMRFKAFAELRDEATGSWRGRIEDGEVVDEGEDEQRDEDEREDEEPTAREEDEGEEEEEEPVAEEDEEEEPVAEEDEEEEPLAEEDEEEEPLAEEDEEEEPAAEEDEEEEPAAEEDEEYVDEDEEDEEPEASEDEEEPEKSDETERKPAARPRRRRRTPARSAR